jgi:hypothetical protein
MLKLILKFCFKLRIFLRIVYRRSRSWSWVFDASGLPASCDGMLVVSLDVCFTHGDTVELLFQIWFWTRLARGSWTLATIFALLEEMQT